MSRLKGKADIRKFNKQGSLQAWFENFAKTRFGKFVGTPHGGLALEWAEIRQRKQCLNRLRRGLTAQRIREAQRVLEERHKNSLDLYEPVKDEQAYLFCFYREGFAPYFKKAKQRLSRRIVKAMVRGDSVFIEWLAEAVQFYGAQDFSPNQVAQANEHAGVVEKLAAESDMVKRAAEANRRAGEAVKYVDPIRNKFLCIVGPANPSPLTVSEVTVALCKHFPEGISAPEVRRIAKELGVHLSPDKTGKPKSGTPVRKETPKDAVVLFISPWARRKRPSFLP